MSKFRFHIILEGGQYMAEVLLQQIFKKYDKQRNAVENFNLKIENREFIVLVGPSGCGKSTTLRMIAGLEEISEGELWINGKLVNDVIPKDRDIAMVFQNYALYPHMTVYENMAFGLKLRKMSKKDIDEKVQHAAEILGLQEFLTRKPKALSGGQRQRVALGRAIVRHAQVFLMDEPLSNLDAKLRVQMRAEIMKLHQNLQTTTIYVTHDQTEAMTMATRLVVMNDGRIQQVGTPQEIYENPKNIFVASFIGTPSINFFRATYSDGKVKIGDYTFELSDEQTKVALNSYQGKEILVGIRPEDLIYGEATPNTFATTIEIVEYMGSETVVHAYLAQQNFIAKLETSTHLVQGNEIVFSINFNKAHFFDKASGDRITL